MKYPNPLFIFIYAWERSFSCTQLLTFPKNKTPDNKQVDDLYGGPYESRRELLDRLEELYWELHDGAAKDRRNPLDEGSDLCHI